MKKTILILVLLIFINSVYGQLADTPSPTLLINSKHTGLSKYSTDIENPSLKWKFDAGDGIESSVAIGNDGTIYFGTFSGKFYALNPDGSIKWTFTKKDEQYRSSPTISKDGTIYFLAISDLRPQYSGHLGFAVDYGVPKLYALNADDGILKWDFVLGGVMSGLIYTPTIGEDGTIYAISGGARMPNATGGNVFWAINPDGTEKWQFNTEEAMFSAAALADDGTIYFGCADGNFYALNPDGTEKWRFTTGEDAKQKDAIFDAVPSIGPDGTIYIGSYDKNLYALHPDGRVKWKFARDDVIEATASIASDGTIYTGTRSKSTDKYLYALSPDGNVKWKFETGEGIDTPVIDANGNLFFGSYDSYLYSLDSYGTLRWKFKTNGGIVVPPTIDEKGTLYIGSWDHFLYAIDGIEREVEKIEHVEKNIEESNLEYLSKEKVTKEMECGNGICESGEERYCHDDCEIKLNDSDEPLQKSEKINFFQRIINFFRGIFRNDESD
ncbi:MAG: PQQ-binding-like beta-propeller repeat protein [archaeon]